MKVHPELPPHLRPPKWVSHIVKFRDEIIVLGIMSPSFGGTLQGITRFEEVDGWSLAGSVALVLGGLALAGTAMSPWRGGPTDLSLLPNQLHVAFAMTGFLRVSLAPLLFGIQALTPPGAPALFVGSVVAGLCVLVLGFWPVQGEFRGLFQRASLAVFFVWLSAVCVVALARCSR